MEWIGILKSEKASHKQKKWAYRKLQRLINIVKHTDAMKIALYITNFAEDLIKYYEKYPEYFEDIKYKIIEIKKHMAKVEKVKKIKKELEELKQHDPLGLLDEIICDDVKNLIRPIKANIYNFGISLSNNNISISATKQEVTIPIYLFKIIRIMEKINPAIAIISDDDINNFLRYFNLERAIERYAKDNTKIKVNMEISIGYYDYLNECAKVWLPKDVLDKYWEALRTTERKLMKTYRLIFNKLLQIISNL